MEQKQTEKTTPPASQNREDGQGITQHSVTTQPPPSRVKVSSAPSTAQSNKETPPPKLPVTQATKTLNVKVEPNDQKTIETLGDFVFQATQIHVPTDTFFPGVAPQQILTNSPIEQQPVLPVDDDSPPNNYTVTEEEEDEPLTTNLDNLTGPQTLNPQDLLNSGSNNNSTQEKIQQEELALLEWPSAPPVEKSLETLSDQGFQPFLKFPDEQGENFSAGITAWPFAPSSVVNVTQFESSSDKHKGEEESHNPFASVFTHTQKPKPLVNRFNPVKFDYTSNKSGCHIYIHFNSRTDFKATEQIASWLRSPKNPNYIALPCKVTRRNNGYTFVLTFPSNTELAPKKETGAFVKNEGDDKVPCIQFANERDKNQFITMFGLVGKYEENEDNSNIVEIYPSRLNQQNSLAPQNK